MDLVRRDGAEVCWRCWKMPQQAAMKVLEIHHLDGDSTRDGEPGRWENLVLACRNCNAAAREIEKRRRTIAQQSGLELKSRVLPNNNTTDGEGDAFPGATNRQVPGHRPDESERSRSDTKVTGERPVNAIDGDLMDASWEARKNQATQPLFEAYVLKRVREEGAVPLEDLIDAAAYVSGVNLQTAKRLIRPLTSDESPLRREWRGNVAYVVVRPPKEQIVMQIQDDERGG